MRLVDDTIRTGGAWRVLGRQGQVASGEALTADDIWEGGRGGPPRGRLGNNLVGNIASPEVFSIQLILTSDDVIGREPLYIEHPYKPRNIFLTSNFTSIYDIFQLINSGQQRLRHTSIFLICVRSILKISNILNVPMRLAFHNKT